VGPRSSHEIRGLQPTIHDAEVVRFLLRVEQNHGSAIEHELQIGCADVPKSRRTVYENEQRWLSGKNDLRGIVVHWQGLDLFILLIAHCQSSFQAIKGYHLGFPWKLGLQKGLIFSLSTLHGRKFDLGDLQVFERHLAIDLVHLCSGSEPYHSVLGRLTSL